MPPCRRQVGASLRRPQRSQEVHASIQSQILREIPHWWILGRCLPPSTQTVEKKIPRHAHRCQRGARGISGNFAPNGCCFAQTHSYPFSCILIYSSHAHAFAVACQHSARFIVIQDVDTHTAPFA